MDPALLRSLERILAVAIGGMSIILGYRLFLALPQQRDASGEVKLPWNISIVMSRVGPGAFFALFGAAVVALGLYSAVTVTTERVVAPGGLQRESTSMSGLVGTVVERESPAVRRLRLEGRIRLLSDLPLRHDLSETEKRSAADEVNAVKLALMAAEWDAEWGDAAAFKAWVDGGAMEPIPEAIGKAARFFRGLGGAP